MAKGKIKQDLIPLKSGIIKVTPIDVAGNPDYSKSVTTARNFVTSTQITTSRTTEDLANGNNEDKTYPTSEKFLLSIETNVYNPDFHTTISGVIKEKVASGVMLYDTTIIPKDLSSGSSYGVKFEENDLTPVASEDKKVHFEIRDSYGNLFADISGASGSPTLGELNYKYDADTKTLTFDKQYENQMLSCVYYVAANKGVSYKSNPILKTDTFMIEVFGEMQSAETGEQFRYYSKLLRATVSGDLPNIKTQKSIQNPITYNFVSAPVPQGLSVWEQKFEPIVNIE